MSTPNSPHSSHSPHTESRDPIMEDDHFSLRYGNPIPVIHNIEKHKLNDFEPTHDVLPDTLTSTMGVALADDKKKQQKPPLTKSNSSFLRDSTICSEFYHDKKGGVTEVEHKDS